VHYKDAMEQPPPRMRLWARRPLTEGEIALGRGLFAEEIAWARVRVSQGPKLAFGLGFGAMVPLGRGIVFSHWRACCDFACASLAEQGWFMHELMHVWQAQRGVWLAGAKLKALGKSAYAYAPMPGAALADYNIERQAEIVRHLFLARAGEPAKGAPSRDWLETIWAGR
jgi:hypothetical protein